MAFLLFCCFILFYFIIFSFHNKLRLFSISEETPVPIDRETPEKYSTQLLDSENDEQQMLEDMSNLLITNDEDVDGVELDDGATINYSNDMSVSKLIDYYEEQQPSASNNLYNFPLYFILEILI